MPNLYIDRKNVELTLSSETLVFYENNERVGTVPLAPIERIYLKGDVKIQASLLAKLGEKGIGIISLSGRKNTPTLFLPKPHNDAKRRLNQYQLSLNEDFCLDFAKVLMLLKLNSAKTWLKYAISQRDDKKEDLDFKIEQINLLIQQIYQQTYLPSLRGIEGRAATVYFSALSDYLPSSLQFNGRNRRPPKDPFNALMSLTYTLLHSEAVLDIHGGGLDPYIGFYHSLDFSRESLACDLIEPLRPLVDNWLIGLFRHKEIRIEHFSTTESGCLLGKKGRVYFYQAYEKQMKIWKKVLNQGIRDLIHLLEQNQILTMPQRKNIYPHQKQPIQYSQYLEDFYLHQYEQISKMDLYY